MSYEAPTAEKLKTRFPEFNSVDDALIDLIFEEVFEEVGDNWPEAKRARAQMLLAAHRLSIEGEPERSGAIAAGETFSGEKIKSEKIGDVAYTYATGEGSSADGSGIYGLGSTKYGAEFKALLKRTFGGIRVAGIES